MHFMGWRWDEEITSGESCAGLLHQSSEKRIVEQARKWQIEWNLARLSLSLQLQSGSRRTILIVLQFDGSGWRVNGWNKWESQCPIGCPPIWMISRTRTNKYNSSLYSCRAQASSSLVIGGFLHSASFLLQLQICQISLLYPQTF